MASERSKRTRSVGNYLNDLNKRVSVIDKATTAGGVGSVTSDTMAADSVTNDSISTQSISADKLEASALVSANNPQKVPTPVKNVDYWSKVQDETVQTILDAYFGEYGVQNIEATDAGIVFSPERSTPVGITHYELSSDGVVTLETYSSHGYEVGDSVTVYELGSPFDGHWGIVEVPSATSISYSILEYYQPRTVYKAGIEIGGRVSLGNVEYNITSKSCVDGLATMTIVNSTIDNTDIYLGHDLEVGYVVFIDGAGSPYDGSKVITEVPEGEVNTIKFSIVGNVWEQLPTAFPLTAVVGNGEVATYDFDKGIVTDRKAVTNEPVIIYGFTPTTGFNTNSGTISQAYTESNFSVLLSAEDPIGSMSTGGYAITSFIKVDAESRLFLTGKNPIPDSRTATISWVADGVLDVYVAMWSKNQNGGQNLPRIIKVDDTVSSEIAKLEGNNSFFFEAPLNIDSYAVFAELLPGKVPVLLKEFYVFESVGDLDHKIEHIVAVTLQNSIATIYTASTHPYLQGDTVRMTGIGSVDPALEDTFVIDSVDSDSNYFTVNAVGIVTTTDTYDADSEIAPIGVSGTVIGGSEKHQSSSIGPSGFALLSADGSDAVSLTEDKTDNYLAIYNADSVSVASISNTGDGTFSNVSAQTITADIVGTTLDPVGNVTFTQATIANATITDGSIYDLATYGITANNITVSSGITAPDVYSNSANTYIVGTFANATYSNNTAYTGSYMDRLARGVIYQSYWDIPTVNVPSGATHFGIAYGTMNLEDGRAYQIHVGADGIKYSPNTNVNLDLLISDQPIQVGTTTSLVRMSQPLRANAAAYTILNQNFTNMTGYFVTNPKTGSTFTNSNTTNLTSGTISAWSKGTGLGAITITLSNATPLTNYLKTGDLVSISNIASANSESIYYNGVFSITKTSNTTFTYAYGGANTTAASQTGGNFALVEPQMVNTVASFTSTTTATSTANTISYSLRNYFIPGQKVTVTGFTAPNANFNVSDVFVTNATATSFTVSSSNVGVVNTSPCVAITASWTGNQLQVNKNILPSKTPLYWILRLRHDTATSTNVAFTTIGNPQGSLVVTDIGQEKSLSYSAPNQASTTEWTTGFPPGLLSGSGVYTPPASTTPVTTVTTYTGTMTINAIASAYYDNYGKGDSGTSDPYANEQSLYQGNPGTASGTKKSIVVFSAISWTGIPTENRAVTKVEVYLRNRHSYNSGGLTTKIGVHGNTSSSYNNLPASIPTTNITSYAPTTTTFTKGQGKWVTLSNTVNSFALSSGLRGVVISLTDNSPITYDSTLSNYGYFDGDLQSDPPRLRITYSYTVTTTT